MAGSRSETHHDVAINHHTEINMGKRLQPVIMEEPEDFADSEEFRGTLELPTADEFMCTEDDVREECAIFGRSHEFEHRVDY